MRRLLLLLLVWLASPAQALPLSTWPSWVSTAPYIARQVPPTALVARGTGTNAYYVIEVDPTTGAIPVSATFTSSDDHNYGTVGAATLRTASQIGNATGAADFGQGTGGAQTLRTVSVLSNGTAGASFGAGATASTTLRAVLATDQTSIPVTESGTWNITNVSGTVSLPTGAATAAKQPALGTAGASSADVISVQGIAGGTAQPISAASLPLPSGASTSAKQPALGTAGSASADVISVQGIASGTALAVSAASLPLPSGAATETTLAAASAKLPATLGQKTMSASLAVTMASDQGSVSVATPGKSYADSARNDYTSTSVTTGAWVQLIASTAAAITGITLFDSCGQTLELGTGAAASETRKMIIPPGGLDGFVPLAIPASTRISVRAISATCSVGELDLTGLN